MSTMFCGIIDTFLKIMARLIYISSRFLLYIDLHQTAKNNARDVRTRISPFGAGATWRWAWYLGMIRVARQGRHARFYDNRRAKTPLIRGDVQDRNKPTFPSTVYALTIPAKMLSPLAGWSVQRLLNTLSDAQTGYPAFWAWIIWTNLLTLRWEMWRLNQSGLQLKLKEIDFKNWDYHFSNLTTNLLSTLPQSQLRLNR